MKLTKQHHETYNAQAAKYAYIWLSYCTAPFKVVNKCERLGRVLVVCNCKTSISKAKIHQKVPTKWDGEEKKHWNRNQSSLVTPVLQHHLSWSSSLQPLPAGSILSIRTFQWSNWELAYTNIWIYIYIYYKYIYSVTFFKDQFPMQQ